VKFKSRFFFIRPSSLALQDTLKVNTLEENWTVRSLGIYWYLTPCPLKPEDRHSTF